MGIALLALRFLWPFLLIGGIYLWADEGWDNARAKRAEAKIATVTKDRDAKQAQLDALDKARIQQQERWAQLTAAEEMREKANDAKRSQVFAGLANAARHDPTSRAVAIPEPAKRMLGDAYAAAKAAEPAPEPAQAVAPDPTAAGLTAWGIDMLEWAATCRDRVEAWQRWYGSIHEP